MALQENNGGPKGYGQPRRKMRRMIMDDEAEAAFPEQDGGDAMQMTQGTGRPQMGEGPSLYGQGMGGANFQPHQGQSNNPLNHMGNRGQQPQFPNYGMTGGRNGGVNPQNQRPQLDPRTNQYSQGPGPQGSPGYLASQAQTKQSFMTPRSDADQRSDWARLMPGVPFPLTIAEEQGLGANAQFASQQPSQGPGTPMGSPGGMAQAVASANAAGFKDIEGAEGYFTPGNFTNQLSGFNTQGWGSGERGSNTLKNTMGKIFSNYDVTQPGALNSVLQDPKFREALPDATIVEHPNQDLLDPDGPNGPMQPVDVIGNAVDGGSGQSWNWQPTDQQGGEQSAFMPQMGGPQGPSQMAYMQGLPGQQQDPSMQAPEVYDESSANQLLQWLMAQQQQGQFAQPPQPPQYL